MKYEREFLGLGAHQVREALPGKTVGNLRSGIARKISDTVFSQRDKCAQREPKTSLMFLECSPGVGGGRTRVQGLRPFPWVRGTYLEHKLLPQLVLAVWSDWAENHTVVVGAQGGDGHNPHHLRDIWHVGLRVLCTVTSHSLPSAAAHPSHVPRKFCRARRCRGCLESKMSRGRGFSKPNSD